MALGRSKPARVVGRYQIVAELGTSYLGPLFAVRAEGEGSAAPLVMMRLVSLARLDADTRVRLLEAAWQALEVRDDRIASVTDVVATNGELGAVSEYAEGLPLRALQGLASVRRKPMPIGVALAVILDVLDGVIALHRAAEDLGPEAVSLYGGVSTDSVFVGTSGRASLLDVAIASGATSVPSLGGHPDRVAYSAPEQLSAEPRADAQTDVFSMGVIAWELFSGRRLFVGSDKIVAQKVLAAKIPRLDELRRKGDPEVPASLLTVITLALEREPKSRLATATDFREELVKSGVTPATSEEIGAYVALVAEGALARLRDALREPVAKAPAGPWPKLEQPTATPAALGSVAAKPPPAKPPLPGMKERPAKPPLPSLKERPMAARPNGIRPRQPTMIGIPVPALGDRTVRPPTEGPPTAPTVEQLELEALADGIASLMPEPDDAPSTGSPHPADAPRRELLSSSSDEPTGQYSARELLNQVEEMGRRSESARALGAEFPEPTTDDLARPTALDLEPARSAAPVEDLWLDDPEPFPVAPHGAEPLVDGLDGLDGLDGTAESANRAEERRNLATHESVLATNAAADARVAERQAQGKQASPAASAPYVPSQIPPPLIHDPRAHRARSMKPPGPKAKRKAGSRLWLGIAVSLALATTSAAVAIVALRHGEGTGATATATATARGTGAASAPAASIAAGAASAPAASIATGAATSTPSSPTSSGSNAASAPTATSSVAAIAASAAAVAPPAASAETEPASAPTKAAGTTTQVARPRATTRSVTHAKPRRAAGTRSKKKRSRFVPDDI